MTEIRTVDGKKIIYDSKNPDDYKKYNPVERKTKTTGEVTYTNPDGTIQ